MSTIKNCPTCKVSPEAVKEYLEAIINFDGAVDSDLDADEEIIDHMDVQHAQEVAKLCTKKERAVKKLLIKTQRG